MKYTSSYDIVKDIIAKLGGDSTIKFSSVYQQAKYIAEMYGADPNRDWSSTFQILLYIYHNFTPPTPTVKYTITFDIGDAEGTAPDTIIAEEGEAIILPYGEGFYKEGYNFTGWRHGEIYYQPGDVFYATEDYDFVAEFELAWNYNGLTFIALEDGAIAMNHFGSNTGSTKPNMEYTLDSVNWNSWNGSEITVSEGQKVGFRGTNAQIGRSTSAYSRFAGSGSFDLQGDIMGLLDGGACELRTMNNTYTFYRLFYQNNSIVNAKDMVLSATVCKGHDYRLMFYQNTNLISAPMIMVETAATYTLSEMFRYCTSLQEIQNEWYVKSNVANLLYYFAQGTQLTKVPDMLFTNNPSTSSLQGAFMDMSNLQYIKCMIESSNVGFASMTTGVAQTGTFVQSTKAAWQRGNSGIPTGWTIECIGDTMTSIASAHTSNSALTVTFDVRSQTDRSWTATAPEWCTLSTYSKIGDVTTITVTNDLNEGEERRGNIVITADDNVITIPIIQDAFYIDFQSIYTGWNMLDNNYWNVIGNDLQQDVDIVLERQTKPWTITSKPDWVTIDTMAGTGNTTIHLTATANADSVYREENIVMQSGDITRNFLVQQFKYPIALSTNKPQYTTHYISNNVPYISKQSGTDFWADYSIGDITPDLYDFTGIKSLARRTDGSWRVSPAFFVRYSWDRGKLFPYLTKIIVDCKDIVMCEQFGSAPETNNVTEIVFTNCENITRPSSTGYACFTLGYFVNLQKVSLGSFTHVNKVVPQSTTASLGSTKLVDVTIDRWYDNIGINVSNSPLITHDSIINILNSLPDNTASDTIYTVKLGATNMAKLTETEIAIATDKGWAVA